MQKALVIDDNRQMAEGLKQMLQLFEMDADIALGSRPALGALRETTPSVVFLDINMPGLSGFEVLGYLQREPRLVEVPVIVVTSDDQPETAHRVQEGGARAIIIKPVTVESLTKALREAGITASA